MEQYIDEDIIDLIKELKDDESGKYGKVGSIDHKIIKDVERGKIVIEDEIMEFEEKTILDGKVKILIPEILETIVDEETSMIIFTSEDEFLNITIKCTEDDLNKSQIREKKDEMINILIEDYPQAKLFENGVRYTNEIEIGFLDFSISTSDNETYNLIFFTALEGKILMCTFSCLEEDMDIWMPISRGIMNSMKITEN